jgi:hypothetical protein
VAEINFATILLPCRRLSNTKVIQSLASRKCACRNSQGRGAGCGRNKFSSRLDYLQFPICHLQRLRFGTLITSFTWKDYPSTEYQLALCTLCICSQWIFSTMPYRQNIAASGSADAWVDCQRNGARLLFVEYLNIRVVSPSLRPLIEEEDVLYSGQREVLEPEYQWVPILALEGGEKKGGLHESHQTGPKLTTQMR